MAAPQGISVACDDGALVADPTWTRLDVTYKVTGWTIDRGRSYELDKTGTGTASFTLIDTTGAFDPTNTAGTFYRRVDPGKQAAIAMQHPMTGTWYTLFRGFISSVRWEPYVSQKHANVRVDLVDAFALLSAAEMIPDGNWGDWASINGDIVFAEDLTTTAMQTRINLVLDQCGWPSTLRQIFTGNIKLQETTYAPRHQALAVVLDAADSEWPGVANVYVNSAGTICAHGRYARFDPDGTKVGSTWDFTRWYCGDKAAAAASPGTVVAVSPPLEVVRDDANLFTSAVAMYNGMLDETIDAAYVTSSATSTYGLRTWSSEGLLVAGGSASQTALQVTRAYSTYYASNYSTPRTRVGQLTVRPRAPVGSAGTATWNLITGVDISDMVRLTTTHYNSAGSATGGGFNDDFFVEGVHYMAAPLNASFPDVTVTMDVSPASYYTAGSPFPVGGSRGAGAAAAKAGSVVIS